MSQNQELYKEMLAKVKNGKKSIAVLIDPDNIDFSQLEKIISLSIKAKIDYFFIGGSLIVDDCLDKVLSMIKELSTIPSIIFPGNNLQINEKADGLLFLSLISGRNPEFLIGKHVVSAPYLSRSSMEIISTGYMLIESGQPTTVSYVSNTLPIPSNKPEIAYCTALAGQLLGLNAIFMDAGSGAKKPISTEMIAKVKSELNIPLIIGGGIRDVEKIKANFKAGADIQVIGNCIEQNPDFLNALIDLK